QQQQGQPWKSKDLLLCGYEKVWLSLCASRLCACQITPHTARGVCQTKTYVVRVAITVTQMRD
ncbi:unnamed protein product, partial [Ceratitis capitata]